MEKLIDADAAIDALCDYLVGKRCPDDGTLTCRLIENEVINKLPSVQPDTNCSEIPNNSDTISRQAEQSACEYCHEDLEGYVKSIEKNGHAYIQNGKLALRANGWWGECAINYCPMCGRKLRGEEE